MREEDGFFRYLWYTYRRSLPLALIPAVVLALRFKPLETAVLPSGKWLLRYVPETLFRYWPHELGHAIAAHLTDHRLIITMSGTALEIGLPLAVFCYLIYRRENLLSWLVLMWLGYAMLDVAYYMADASALKLAYVRPFDTRVYTAADVKTSHDWVVMLTAAGHLKNARQFGALVYFIGVWCLCLPPVLFFLSEKVPPRQEYTPFLSGGDNNA